MLERNLDDFGLSGLITLLTMVYDAFENKMYLPVQKNCTQNCTI